MKGITLKQHEVKQLQDSGEATVWREIKLRHGYPGINTEWASVNSDGHGGWVGWYPLPLTDEETQRLYPNGGGFKCPYATPGEVRFVRETWGVWVQYHYIPIAQIPATAHIEYRSASSVADTFHRWKSSTTMPEWASRYTVNVNTVTVEKRGDAWEWGIGLERVL